jgi:hypothetical protein
MRGSPRTRSVLVQVVVATLVASGVASATAPPARAGSLDAMFLDSGSGDLTDGRAITVIAPTDGTVGAEANVFLHAPKGADISLVVNPADPQADGSIWFLNFGAPAGEALAPGVYENTTSDPFRDGQPYLAAWGNSVGCSPATGWFTVHEATFDENGTPLSFAASFAEQCSAPNWVYGEIRYHASTELLAHESSINEHVFPVTVAGSRSDPVLVALTNTGSVALHAGPTTIVGGSAPAAFVISHDTCSGSTLSPGDSCTAEVSYSPTAAGWQDSYLRFADDTLGGHRDVRLIGRGLLPTATTISIGPFPNPVDPAYRLVSIAVSPNPGLGGIVQLIVDGVDGQQVILDPAGMSGWATTAPDGTQIQARFLGWPPYAPSLSNLVVMDRVPPSVTPPRAGLVAGSQLGTTTIPVRLAWSGSDDRSGIRFYDLAIRRDQGSYGSVTSVTPAVQRSLWPSHTYRARVRATDRDSNVCAWAYGPAFRLTSFSELSSYISYLGPWQTYYSSSSVGGRFRSTRVAGARATFRFYGESAGWITSWGPTRGRARVYVDGHYIKTIDLRQTSSSSRRLAFVTSRSVPGWHSVTIRVVGDGRVDIDGFATLRW